MCPIESFLRRLVLLCLAVLMIGISVGAASQHQLVIYTVNYPLAYFAERIVGKHAKVVFPAPRDVDPTFWTPAPEIIIAYQGADIILLNGADYAKWVDKATLSRRKMVNTSAGFKDEFITIAGTVSHSHGPGDKHTHGATAFTTWLDFSQAALQAEAIKNVLVRKQPELKKDFVHNYQALQRDLLSLDKQMKTTLSNKPQRSYFASHPVYQYFARRYGLALKSLHWEADKFPSDSQWAELKAMRGGHTATWMIWEGEPDPLSVQGLKKIGISSLVLDPCANTPPEGDWLSVMRNNLENLKATLR
jgi:zinc transport system substrate-binding protein